MTNNCHTLAGKDAEGVPLGLISELENRKRPVVGASRHLNAGFSYPAHWHEEGQFVYAVKGTTRVSTDTECWMVPPQRAVWLPPHTVHVTEAIDAVALKTIYVAGNFALPDHCCVLNVSPLLRELVLEVVRLGMNYDDEGDDGRLVRVLVDQINMAQVAPLNLPLSLDRRARCVADALLADPSDDRPLQAWTAYAGASERTLARLFYQGTGMTFGKWRRQMRLIAAIASLGAGTSVASIAMDLGYANPSAFITMFRRTLGTTPGQYMSGTNQTREI